MTMPKKRPIRHAWLGLALAVATLAAACVQEKPRATSYFSDYTPFDIASRAAFADYRQVVGSYLRQKRGQAGSQACVVGLTRGSRDTDVTWVIWRDGDRLIRWFAGENNLELSSRNLSLTDDVVPTDADVGSSTYLVSRPWVNELERLCAAHGQRVTTVQ